MSTLKALIRRNTKLFFRDKGMFVTAMITPIILLVLYITFLGRVYQDSFVTILEEFGYVSRQVDSLVAGQLFSSLMAVCCVTISFCSNLLMVQDKVSGAADDFAITPVHRSVLSLAYYLSTLFVTLIICLACTGLCFIYMAVVGWYYTILDVCLILLDIFLVVMFGVALSSLIHYFLSSQGQISAVGTIVSSVYGFVCGAYMPISQFGTGLQNVLSLLPGTYATGLLRNHTMNAPLREMAKAGLPEKLIENLRDVVDCNLYFFGSLVKIPYMYLILGSTVALLIGAYILVHQKHKNRS